MDNGFGCYLLMIQLDPKVIKKSYRRVFDDVYALNIGVHIR